MKIAIPERQGRVSPVFDSAHQMWIVHFENGREVFRMPVGLHPEDPLEKARLVARFGVDLLICGAIARPTRMVLASSGMGVKACICGSLEEVIRAFSENRLGEERFQLPGTRPARAAPSPKASAPDAAKAQGP